MSDIKITYPTRSEISNLYKKTRIRINQNEVQKMVGYAFGFSVIAGILCGGMYIISKLR